MGTHVGKTWMLIIEKVVFSKALCSVKNACAKCRFKTVVLILNLSLLADRNLGETSDDPTRF